MSLDEFWYDEPRLLDSYIKKHELELDEINYKSWLIGLYNYDAFSVIMEKAFSKSSQKDTYFEKPLEQFNSNYIGKDKQKIEQEKNNKFRRNNNYWAKFGKKGV